MSSRHSSRSLSQVPNPDRERYRRRSVRSRSPTTSDRHYRHRHPHRRHERDERDLTSAAIALPFQARQVSKHDLAQVEPLFAMYLDIQKGLLLEDLSDLEIKGRWKSFVRKWNRGELAEGWYHPGTFEKARRNKEEDSRLTSSASGQGELYRGAANERREKSGFGAGSESERHTRTGVHDGPSPRRDEVMGEAVAKYDDDDDDDDGSDYGPRLVSDVGVLRSSSQRAQASGPAIPTLQDLDLRRESAMAEATSVREAARDQYRSDLRSHRSEMRHIEDEIAPRAEPGTRERRLEKRREAAAANRTFAETRRGGSPLEAAPDDELMGTGENDLDALKKAREREQRKKNERELRREEILRARAAEREERVRKYRQKEEETIGWLKTLAKQRFG